MASISPSIGSPKTVFLADLSDSNLNFTTNITGTSDSGEIRIAEINESSKIIYFYLNDTINGTKTLTFTDENNESISLTVYLKFLNPPNTERSKYTETNATRPKWPYRTF